MSEQALELDATIIAPRFRNRAPRQTNRVEPRGIPFYLRKHAVADIWSPDTPLVKHTGTQNNAEQVNAHIAPTTKLDGENISLNEAALKRIDFAERANQWRLEHKTNRRQISLKTLFTTQNLLIAMAVMVFLVGVGAAINTVLTNKEVVEAVSSNNSQPTTENAVSTTDSDETEPKDTQIREYNVEPHMPRTISFPKFGTKGIVIPVGVDKDNVMQAPTNIHKAGWFNESALPGAERGATVIDGHVSGPTKLGIFGKLKELRPGDKVHVEKGDRSVLVYTVVSSKKYDANNVDMNEVVNTAPGVKRGLNLITCTGSLDKSRRSYTERLVVFTQLDT
jgi:LPXTG-site transpeptidase (sortase) family protein